MLQINKDYRITSDGISYSLEERKIHKKNGKERWEKYTFHNRIEGALNRFRRIEHLKLLKDTDMAISEVIEYLEKTDEEIKEIFINSEWNN